MDKIAGRLISPVVDVLSPLFHADVIDGETGAFFVIEMPKAGISEVIESSSKVIKHNYFLKGNEEMRELEQQYDDVVESTGDTSTADENNVKLALLDNVSHFSKRKPVIKEAEELADAAEFLCQDDKEACDWVSRADNLRMRGSEQSDSLNIEHTDVAALVLTELTNSSLAIRDIRENTDPALVPQTLRLQYNAEKKAKEQTDDLNILYKSDVASLKALAIKVVKQLDEDPKAQSAKRVHALGRELGEITGQKYIDVIVCDQAGQGEPQVLYHLAQLEWVKELRKETARRAEKDAADSAQRASDSRFIELLAQRESESNYIESLQIAANAEPPAKRQRAFFWPLGW